MNEKQRSVVLGCCVALAAGFFGYQLFLGFIPWATWKPEGGTFTFFGTTIPHRPELPVAVPLFGLAVPLVLIGGGLFVFYGGDRGASGAS